MGPVRRAPAATHDVRVACPLRWRCGSAPAAVALSYPTMRASSIVARHVNVLAARNERVLAARNPQFSQRGTRSSRSAEPAVLAARNPHVLAARNPHVLAARSVAPSRRQPEGPLARRFSGGSRSATSTPARFIGLFLPSRLKPKKKRPVNRPPLAAPHGPGRERPGYRPFGLARERATLRETATSLTCHTARGARAHSRCRV
jgi:hypothetical protein